MICALKSWVAAEEKQWCSTASGICSQTFCRVQSLKLQTNTNLSFATIIKNFTKSEFTYMLLFLS